MYDNCRVNIGDEHPSITERFAKLDQNDDE